MCSLIIEKYINHPRHYESLSLSKLVSFYNIKKKSKCHKPKIIRSINYNKYNKFLFNENEIWEAS
jgi:hypothetical protein